MTNLLFRLVTHCQGDKARFLGNLDRGAWCVVRTILKPPSVFTVCAKAMRHSFAGLDTVLSFADRIRTARLQVQSRKQE